MPRLIIPVLVALLVSGPAWAKEQTIGDMIVFYARGDLKTKHQIEQLLGSIGDGITVANERIVNRGDPPLYCPPSDLALTGSQYFEILQSFINKYKRIGDMPVAAKASAMMRGLQMTFPCKK